MTEKPWKEPGNETRLDTQNSEFSKVLVDVVLLKFLLVGSSLIWLIAQPQQVFVIHTPKICRRKDGNDEKQKRYTFYIKSKVKKIIAVQCMNKYMDVSTFKR